jgi:hypothetical protein
MPEKGVQVVGTGVVRKDAAAKTRGETQPQRPRRSPG